MTQDKIREEHAKFTDRELACFTMGRISVLHDFDAICMADAFVGFTTEEWDAVKKFINFNRLISRQ